MVNHIDLGMAQTRHGFRRFLRYSRQVGVEEQLSVAFDETVCVDQFLNDFQGTAIFRQVAGLHSTAQANELEPRAALAGRVARVIEPILLVIDVPIQFR